jgi:hypothetical protein
MPAAVASIATIALPPLRTAAISNTPTILPEPASEVWCPPD